LAADKISPSGSAYLYVEEAKWPVYYSTGSRVLGLAPVANFTADVVSGNSPLTVKFLDSSVNEPTAWQWTFTGGTPSTSTIQHPTVVYNTAGTYPVTLKCTNTYGNNTMTKTAYITVLNPGNQSVPGSVLITQVYGGGGNSGSPYKSDFIDFCNTTNADINMGGWCLYYYDAVATTTTQKFEFPANTIIKANKYFGLKAAEGTGTQTPWNIMFDAVSTLDLSETTGKLILMKSNAAFTLSSSPAVGEIINNTQFIDYVPFGMYSTPIWGNAMSSNISGFTAAKRKIVNGKNQYTPNIGNDFEIVTPLPRNSNTIVGVKPAYLNKCTVYTFDNKLFIKGAEQNQKVDIYNITGNKVHSSQISTQTLTLDFLPKGVYIVTVDIETFKIILQ